NLSVEHILPQTLNAVWGLELGDNAYEIHQLYKDTIGNLAMTNYNSEMSNRSFDHKKTFYKDSNIKTTRDISSYNHWTEEEMLKRADELYGVIKEVWKLPEDNYQNISDKRLIANQEYSIRDNIKVTGYKPRYIIIDEEHINVSAWNEMLQKTAIYLYNLDSELFESLLHKNDFKNVLSSDRNHLRSAMQINDELYIEGNYSAQSVVGYIDILTSE